MKSTPASRIIQAFGSVPALAHAIGYNKASVYRWNGYVPTRAAHRIKAAAERLSIPLPPEIWEP